MRRRAGLRVLLPVALWIAGCSVPPRMAVELELRPEYERELAQEAFAAGRTILSGFAPLSEDHWRPGSRVLLGLEVRQGESRQVSFVLVELRSGPIPAGFDVVIYPADEPPPPSEPSCHYVRATGSGTFGTETGRLPVNRWSVAAAVTDAAGQMTPLAWVGDHAILLAVHLYDAGGERCRSSYVLAPEAFLREGLWAQCAAALARPAATEESIRAEAVKVMPALFGLGQIILAPNLKPVIKPFVPRPSLWSLMWRAGRVEVEVYPRLERVRVEDRFLPAVSAETRGYCLPIDVRLNGEPELACVLTAVEPRSPFDLVGGVIAADGERSRMSDRAFSVRVLATAVGESP